jgi:hypothetical protein
MARTKQTYRVPGGKAGASAKAAKTIARHDRTGGKKTGGKAPRKTPDGKKAARACGAGAANFLHYRRNYQKKKCDIKRVVRIYQQPFQPKVQQNNINLFTSTIFKLVFICKRVYVYICLDEIYTLDY